MEELAIVWAGVCGAVLGLFFVAGLWFTVQQIPKVRAPELLLLTSFVVRFAVVLGGFYVVMAGRWERAAACMAGFLVARTLLVWKLRRPAAAAGEAEV